MPHWDDGPAADPLAGTLGRPDLQQLRLPADCPACGARDLHVFYRRHGDDGMGGTWAWCSNCRRFFHGRTAVPMWWREADFITDEALAAVPEVLERLASELDAHWNETVVRDANEGAE